MGDWNKSGEKWHEFLMEVEVARADLGCSLSNAWFRGHADKDWSLKPSLLRLSKRPAGYMSADDAKSLSELEATSREKRTRKKNIRKELRALRRELGETIKNKDRVSELSVRNYISRIQVEGVNASTEIENAELKAQNLHGIESGEYDAFIDFRFRSGTPDISSWVTLAKMQHYGIPTRLLDWSETLIISIYFALSQYISELSRLWEIDKATLGSKSAYPLKFHALSGLPEPSIWILNPYRLTQTSIGLNSLWSPSAAPQDDYYNSFLVEKNWPRSKPIPMYSPWENPRIAAQQGMFTIHGTDKRALDEQADKKTIRQVIMSPEAAIYGTKLIHTAFGLNHFTLFRDLDRLGSDVRKRYLD